ncbi:MAG: ribonuclease R [Sedimentisphaerales bacterium]|nr:ribonuclease R [Sedimentisphaerales bacterium]
MSETFEKKIIKVLKHPDYKPLKLTKLAKMLGVESQDYSQFKSAFEQLRSAGHVIIGERNLVTLPQLSGRVVGTFRANPRGFGFLTPLEPNLKGDLFIPVGSTKQAMTGDIVAAKVIKKKTTGKAQHSSPTGRITEVLERAENKFVGTLVKTPQGWLVQPDGRAFIEPIGVDDVTAKDAHENDKVEVEIISYPTERYSARGVILEVLGKTGRYETEIESIIRRYRLPQTFDEGCLGQVHKAASQFDPGLATDRDDITGKLIITIDPPDAKDFDDAISLEKDSRGNRILGVHIADVSHFVRPDSSLDCEAKTRGNSVYLTGKTIPMLPEALSNGICSLQPGQKRFAQSVYITYDRDAKVLSRRFANSVICSSHRLTYRQADKILAGHTKQTDSQLVELLKNMEKLARLIERRRLKEGMLQLDLPETELIMNHSREVVDAVPADSSYPHRIIEMFMVEANEAVASLLDSLNITFIRRIHPEPDPLSMKKLSKLIKSLGLSISRTPDRPAIQSLLSAVRNTDHSLDVNLLILRSLQKAEYSPVHLGHYALASTNYCHFTSPIRRYADLLVHRLLQSYLQGTLATSGNGAELAEVGRHITFTEQRAEDAERELKMILILQMLNQQIGQVLDCVITGLTSFGVFAQSSRFGVEGLIPLSELGPDQWKFNPKNYNIIGRNTGRCFRLGQSIKTTIVSVNIPARQLNLTLA